MPHVRSGFRLVPFALALLGAAAVSASALQHQSASGPLASYFDNSGREDVLSGGVRRIPITTPKGTFTVWTKRTGNNPKLKVLLLHGGPAATHEIFEGFDTWFPAAGIEYYNYDQLGSFYSDQPDKPELWEVPRFVDEVEQVRKALALDRSNFVLYGQSWGGMLAMEYALAHPEALKGLVISNMMSSIPAYNEYAKRVLMPAMDPMVLAEIQAIEARKGYDEPRYEELLLPNFYVHHFLRLPPERWPDGVVRALTHINKKIYIPMQGPSEMGASGKIEKWDRSGDLKRITAPTLVIGAKYDTMDPKHMAWMATQIPGARYLECPNGSHLAQYDDQKVYMEGLLDFLRDIEAGQPLTPALPIAPQRRTSSLRGSALVRADVMGDALGRGRSKVIARPHPAQPAGDDPAGVDRRRRCRQRIGGGRIGGWRAAGGGRLHPLVAHSG